MPGKSMRDRFCWGCVALAAMCVRCRWGDVVVTGKHTWMSLVRVSFIGMGEREGHV